MVDTETLLTPSLKEVFVAQLLRGWLAGSLPLPAASGSMFVAESCLYPCIALPWAACVWCKGHFCLSLSNSGNYMQPLLQSHLLRWLRMCQASTMVWLLPMSHMLFSPRFLLQILNCNKHLLPKYYSSIHSGETNLWPLSIPFILYLFFMLSLSYLNIFRTDKHIWTSCSLFQIVGCFSCPNYIFRYYSLSYSLIPEKETSLFICKILFSPNYFHKAELQNYAANFQINNNNNPLKFIFQWQLIIRLYIYFIIYMHMYNHI